MLPYSVNFVSMPSVAIFIFLYKYSFIDNYPAVCSSSNNELLVLLELIAIAIFL